MDAALARVGEQVREGEQAYIVVPAIEPSRGDPNLEELVPRLQQVLADVPFGVVHGRLDRATRDDTMAAFRDGTLRVLLATTVIEVGVDVPNASLMVIWGADRFGLAQLHQLRGRVGRQGRRLHLRLGRRSCHRRRPSPARCRGGDHRRVRDRGGRPSSSGPRRSGWGAAIGAGPTPICPPAGR